MIGAGVRQLFEDLVPHGLDRLTAYLLTVTEDGAVLPAIVQ